MLNGFQDTIAAIPVSPPETLGIVKGAVDELVALERPIQFMAVGGFYRHFDQLDDGEVKSYLAKANRLS